MTQTGEEDVLGEEQSESNMLSCILWSKWGSFRNLWGCVDCVENVTERQHVPWELRWMPSLLKIVSKKWTSCVTYREIAARCAEGTIQCLGSV